MLSLKQKVNITYWDILKQSEIVTLLSVMKTTVLHSLQMQNEFVALLYFDSNRIQFVKPHNYCIMSSKQPPPEVSAFI